MSEEFNLYVKEREEVKFINKLTEVLKTFKMPSLCLKCVKCEKELKGEEINEKKHFYCPECDQNYSIDCDIEFDITMSVTIYDS